MGKVKNLIWDEIEYDTYEETTPTWFRDDPIRAVPTQEDLSAAAQASYDAFEAYWADAEAGRDTTNSHAAYMCAIERHAELRFQRNQAMLKEGVPCPLI